MGKEYILYTYYFREVLDMKTYALTVFDKSGEKLMDESFTAANDDEAKEIGQTRLNDEGYSEHTHRCVTQDAKLILFHR